ncbi:hypothetical protein DPMN_097765 [Dreissena polymorpha]|uniref:Uncharacterized protein n=1 Tax=Dreissena polymorpha TaxID=45954 RepID=A0A9D4LBR4_DREPO|nr:hypothetical protein DPMN_097765 [Dreissena polymorpha]
MSMSELARHLPQLDFGPSAECRCQSWHIIRPSSIFGTFAECRCQSWLDIHPSSIFGDFAECRCQSWLDSHPSSIFGTRDSAQISLEQMFGPSFMDIERNCYY